MHALGRPSKSTRPMKPKCCAMGKSTRFTPLISSPVTLSKSLVPFLPLFLDAVSRLKMLLVGDKIPADCRLIEIFSSTFRVDQAILTGESYSVEKILDAVKDKKAVKQDMLNMIFSGTAVTHGKAHAVVVQTGRSTAIGDIHESITSQIAQKTPLKQKLDDFGDQLAKVTIASPSKERE